MIARTRPQGPKDTWPRAAVFVVTLAFAGLTVTSGQSPFFSQETFPRGQTIAPAFEGWEENPDGTFNMVFGYFNRNWEEQPHVPIGPDNNIEPGGPDQGQPTHFFPRRNKMVFRVQVPKDFGNKELVWTLTTRGKTEKAYGTFKEDYKLDSRVLQTNTHMRLNVRGYQEFDKDMLENKPPVVRVEGDARRTVTVGEPLALSAVVTDDGKLKRLSAPAGGVDSDNTALGLRVAWFVYRGSGDKVAFDPEQFKVYQDKKPGGNSPFAPGWAPPPIPADGKFPAKVTFGAPGTYVVRVMAHDGGLDTSKDVTVTVVPPSSASVAAGAQQHRAALLQSLPRVTELPSGYRPVRELADRGVFYSASAPLFRVDDGDAHHGLAGPAAWATMEAKDKGARRQGVLYGVEDGAITSAGYLIRQADLVASKSFHGLTFRELGFPAARYLTIDLVRGATADSNQYLWLWHFLPQQGLVRPMLPAGELPSVTSLPKKFVVVAAQNYPNAFHPRMGRHRRDESTSGRRLPAAVGDDSVFYGEAAGKLIFIEYVFSQQDFAAGASWPAMPLDGLPIPAIDNVHIMHYDAAAAGAPGTFTAHMYFIPEETYLAWETEPPKL